MPELSENKKRRADALDALRGLAILLMILSGSVPFSGAGQLPGWMYHAQVPPPDHVFSPGIPGITWVDLVFPFFLFAMGAAFPFALNARLDKGVPLWKIVSQIFGRGLLLAWFAIYIQHIKPYALNPSPTASDWFIGLSGFLLLFPVLLRLPKHYNTSIKYGVKGAGIICMVLLISFLEYPGGGGFSLGRSDIIILVLANTALFGSLVWLVTRNNVLLRLGVLGILLALRLTSDIEGSWNQQLWNFTPFPWLYRLYYLQYLFIVIPGTIIGDYIYRWVKQEDEFKVTVSPKRGVALAALMILFIVINLASLYGRLMVANLFINLLLLIAGYLLLKKGEGATWQLYKKLFGWGAFWLVLGLFFEAYEGGIKKDHATLSYYFVTTGLAVFCLIGLSVVTDYFNRRGSLRLIIDNGLNPMIAYVAGSNLIMPLLALTSLNTVLGYLLINPWLGFLKGVIFTLLVAFATSFFTRRKLFWRT